MRILISFPGLHRVARGAEVAMEAVASGLSARGHDVTVYGSGPALDRNYRYRRIPVIPRERFERWPAGPFVREPSSYESIVFNVGVALRYRPGRYDLTLSCGFPWDNLVLRRPRLGRRRPPHVFVTENGDLPAAPQARARCACSAPTASCARTRCTSSGTTSGTAARSSRTGSTPPASVRGLRPGRRSRCRPTSRSC